MLDQLFTQVSLEEQAVVAGGKASAVNLTGYVQNIEGLWSGTTSGPNGSSSQSYGFSDKRLTFSLANLTLGATLGIPKFRLPLIP
ncbi:hypothetical protein B6N60_04351 [Richelia sinica FACHB-800]|uniref:Uncharacterized protein n=1 Tax=Richelia sinica FACHB-800 TaxID=1357546 RepID=A0A975TCZ5_9NOST|nr:CTB family bacteriocin [Richelia sinica]MBD2665500.1 hypothetical protein [Richelia sinica FACHB-800]QXE25631.1 hypothetical protein B6N60_04351 [Richelia sinica FACHB-800]